MRTIWQSLAWKEWHEHKWKLASITAVLIGATSLSMCAVREKHELAFGMMFMCIIPLSIFVGLGIAANERSRNTLAFLQAQPVPLWRVGLIKFVAGLATLFIPLVVTAVSLYVWCFVFDWTGVDYSKRVMEGGTGPIDTGNCFVDIVIFCALLAMSLMTWSAATGVNRKDEISAGAVALAVMIGWAGIVFFFMWYFIDRDAGVHTWINVLGFAVLPCGIAAISTAAFSFPEFLLGVGVAAVVHLLLAAFYARQFGQTMERAIASPKVVTRETRRIDWLDSPRRSPLAAVVWKQFRESIPIALAGLAAIVGTTIVMYAAERSSHPTTRFAEMYFTVSISLGFCIALVAGIGVALQDMGPQLSTFWRSRPIDGSLWFWTKFVTGLLIVVAVIYVPQLLLTGRSNYEHPEYTEVILVVATLHIATYAVAVAMTCLIRHAVYAAILSMGALIASVAVAWLAWTMPIKLGLMEAPGKDSLFFPKSMELPAMLTGLVACFVVSAVIGWLAVRNDWGWKSRY